MKIKKIIISIIAAALLMLLIIAATGVGTIVEHVANKNEHKETYEEDTLTNQEPKKYASPIDAVFDFYDDNDLVVIYDEIPFEHGTLVLADGIMEGEHYPQLFYVTDEGYLTDSTIGSFCWTLNYTYFKGYVIYYGLAGTETRRFTESPTSVKKIEARFEDKIKSTIPRKTLVTDKNLSKENRNILKNNQGYILPVKGDNLADNLISVYNDGKKISLSDKSSVYYSNNMPDYLKSNKKEIYNSFGFTFAPMLSIMKWKQTCSDGDVCLNGKTDKNGNINALYLKPREYMSLASSYKEPSNIKFLYLSCNDGTYTKFSPGETVDVIYPESRDLFGCQIVELTKQAVEKETITDSLKEITVNKKKQLTLPRKSGYYLILLSTLKVIDMQSYYGIFIIQ